MWIKRFSFATQSTFNMKRVTWLFPIALAILTLTQSCGINSNLMLKTPKEYVFDSIPEDLTVEEYRIAPNDVISFRLYANGGFLVIDLSAGTASNGGTGGSLARGGSFIQYLVRPDSTARLPMIGDTKLAGYTKLEAEMYLQGLYEQYYKDPYVQIKVTNRRVIVFPGNGADAKVITLSNNNTTLLETIAQAGGIPPRGRAKRIKLIRRVNNVRQVYLLDLATIDGIREMDMIMQANDIVYVEPVPEIARELVRDVAPFVSLVSSLWLIYVTIRNVQ